MGLIDGFLDLLTMSSGERETKRLSAERAALAARRAVVEARASLAQAEADERERRLVRGRLAQIAAERDQLEAERGLAEAKLRAHAELARLAQAAYEAEQELRLYNELRGLPPALVEARLRQEMEKERLLLATHLLRRARLGDGTGAHVQLTAAEFAALQTALPPPPAAALPGIPAPSAQQPAFSAYVSDEDINAIATRAVASFGRFRGPEADAAWRRFGVEVRQRYDALVASEIEERTRALLEDMA